MGPTQYWPKPSPKTCRKRKVVVKPEVSNVHEVETKGQELHEANLPIYTGNSDDGVGNVAPCSSEATLNEPTSDKRCSTPPKTEDRLTENEDVNTIDYKNLSELNTPHKHDNESMHKLDQLAQV